MLFKKALLLGLIVLTVTSKTAFADKEDGAGRIWSPDKKCYVGAERIKKTKIVEVGVYCHKQNSARDFVVYAARNEDGHYDKIEFNAFWAADSKSLFFHVMYFIMVKTDDVGEDGHSPSYAERVIKLETGLADLEEKSAKTIESIESENGLGISVVRPPHKSHLVYVVENVDGSGLEEVNVIAFPDKRIVLEKKVFLSALEYNGDTNESTYIKFNKTGVIYFVVVTDNECYLVNKGYDGKSVSKKKQPDDQCEPGFE